MSDNNTNMNGLYHEVDKIKGQVDAMRVEMDRRDDLLIDAIRNLSLAVTKGFEQFGGKLDVFMDVARKSLPISAVIWLMAILTFALLGVEGIKELRPFLHAYLTGALK